jgi:hypothetical protein
MGAIAIYRALLSVLIWIMDLVRSRVLLRWSGNGQILLKSINANTNFIATLLHSAVLAYQFLFPT